MGIEGVSRVSLQLEHGRYKSQEAKGGVRVTDDVDRDFYRWDELRLSCLEMGTFSINRDDLRDEMGSDNDNDG